MRHKSLNGESNFKNLPAVMQKKKNSLEDGPVVRPVVEVGNREQRAIQRA